MDLEENKFDTIEDFLLEPSFRRLVFNKDVESETFWSKWNNENPGKKHLFNYCFSILHNLYMQHKSISDEEVKREIEIILSKIRDEEARESKKQSPKGIVAVLNTWKWAVAAAVIIIFASIYLISKNSTPASSYEAFVKKVKSNSLEFINTSDTIQVIHLADGSNVSLYKKSKITYAFINNKREVYMQGKGFFEVKKNPAQPFIVYTDKVVTKVLGTSFFVDAYPSNKDVSVVVRTGKVSVYKRSDFTEKAAKPFKLDGILITANQQVVLDKSKNDLIKLVVDNPVKVSNNLNGVFQFEATPVKDVFAAVEQEYGINILFDEEALANCTLTAKLGEESFYDKLNIITKAIGATYVVIDGNVLVNSNGCK
jgi:transmembrane sensor